MKTPAMKTKDIVVMGMLVAILFAGKLALSFLPNIEIVSLLIILYTQFYREKVFAIIYTFVLMEGLLYGFGLWWISYLYIWSILALIVLCLKKQDSVVMWAIISGAYGLSFGTLSGIPQFFINGWGGGIAYIAMGIPFDITHCIGNVVTCLVLYRPLHMLLEKIIGRSVEL